MQSNAGKRRETLVTPASVDGQLQALDKGDEPLNVFPPPPPLSPKKETNKKNKEKNKEKEKRKREKRKKSKVKNAKCRKSEVKSQK